MKRRLWFNLIGLAVAAVLLAACGLLSIGGGDPPGATDEEDQGKPSVVIDAPPSGSTAAMDEDVFVQSTSTDTVGITRVDLLVDDMVVRSDVTPEEMPQTQFSVLQAWSAAPGEHTLSVIAYRADGTASDPASVTITVSEEAAAADAVEAEGSSVCMAKASIQLAIRQGPSVDYPEIGYLELGEELAVSGKNADASWWQVDFNGNAGWISARYTYSSGGCDTVSVAQAPPLPAGDSQSGGSAASGGGAASSDSQMSDAVGGGGDTASMDAEYSPTPSTTPEGPSPTPTATYTPGGPTVTATYTYTPSPTATNTLPGPTATYTYTPTTVGPTVTYTPSYTPTTQPAAQIAPADANFNSPLNIPLDSTASVTDFVSYPGGDTQDKVRWDITGMNSNSALSGGRARLTLAVSCFGQGIEYVEFFTGGQTYECGQTIVDREVTYDSRTGQVTITAVGGSDVYVQWVLTGTAVRVN